MEAKMLGVQHSTMLDEARDIGDSLLIAQEAINMAGQTELEHRLAEIRERFGHGQAAETDTDDLIDVRIRHKTLVVAPELVTAAIPLTATAAETTRRGREAVEEILTGEDDRVLATVGPCSIHNLEEAMQYAEFLARSREKYGNDLEIVMRTYFEKPRSVLGWKGFVYDPELNGNHDINLGLIASRLLMVQIAQLGVPTATERLNALTPQYLNGLVTYDAIGARNVTDQGQREYASGSSSPVGFKNTPEGNIADAVDAMMAASAPHTFLGLDQSGAMMQVETTGNPLTHVILRGSKDGPNYSEAHVADTIQRLRKAGLPQQIIVDASHGNSRKDYRRQINAVSSVAGQIADGQTALKGMMIESYLCAGNQQFAIDNPHNLQAGVSITDACVDIKATDEMFEMLARAVRERRRGQAA